MTGSVRWGRYGLDALDALRDVVAEAKRDDPMNPVTVIVSNNIAGIVARRFLARGLTPPRRGIAAIRFTTPRLSNAVVDGTVADPTLVYLHPKGV